VDEHSEEQLTTEDVDVTRGGGADNVGGDPTEEIHHDIYSVANVITVMRLLLIPFFFSALISDSAHSDTLAFVLFVVAASTDWLDGWIARRTGTVTAIGKVIDPLVDRLLIAAAVIGLYMVDRLPLWIPVVLIARDLYLLYGSWVLEKYHLRLAVTKLGKATTAVLLVGFASLVWGQPVVGDVGFAARLLDALGLRPEILGSYIVLAGVVMSLSAAAQYTIAARAAVRAYRRDGGSEAPPAESEGEGVGMTRDGADEGGSSR
jgi:cardiolipin synthase